jgi:hypothetical protein
MDVTYERLPGEGYIRLLQLKTGLLNGQLFASFKTVPVDSAPEYTAVSYTWDDPTPVKWINFAGNRRLPVSRTLSDLFDTLRLRGRTFTLWIDSLCINQVDLDEKASQVKNMGKVYSAATQVMLWLGAATPQSRAAFRYIASRQRLDWPDDWEREKNYKGLGDVLLLLARPWFHRVWVVQEVTLNDNVQVVCGQDAVKFAALENCVLAIWKYYEGINRFDEEDRELRGLWSITRMLYIRREFRDAGFVQYERLLEAAFHLQATQKQDMVFAFRGIADRDRPVPDPDYTTPVERIYKETAAALLCNSDTLDLLALCGIARGRGADLPTWAPDLRYFSFSEPLVACSRAGWDTGGMLGVRPRLESDDQLRLEVREVDTVAVVCPVFSSQSVDMQKEAMNALIALKSRLPEDVADEMWKKMLSSSLTLGLDLEDMPIEPEHHRHFLEWATWLESASSEDGLSDISSNPFQRALAAQVDGWRAFMTTNGLLGIGPDCTRAGDIVTSVPGSRLTLLVRRNEISSNSDCDTADDKQRVLVSWCFTHGIMFGEQLGRQQDLIQILMS